MSHPQAPQRQPTSSETEQYVKVMHNTALIALVACPLLAALPPRKLDIYTFGLGGTTLLSANYLVRERSGRSIWQHVTGSNKVSLHGVAPLNPSHVPSLEDRDLRKEVEYMKAEGNGQRGGDGPVTAELKQHGSWKERREQEIREDVEEGKSYQDMIADQIWEVWNWGKKKDDDE